MPVALLSSETDFAGWRTAARQFCLDGVEPGDAHFSVARPDVQAGLFETAGAVAPTDRTTGSAPLFSVSRAFIDVARAVTLHRLEDRFDLLYRLLWRTRQEPHLMQVVSDPEVSLALGRVKSVSRAAHKMKAFVRFRRVETENGHEQWVAWFEPAHRVLERTAPFFAERFTNMNWSILTPDGTASWDGKALEFGPPASIEQAPAHDEIEDFWKTYYASTFNPARLKISAMTSEMPKRYWANLPEAALIPGMIAKASERASAMTASDSTAANVRMARAHAPSAAAPTSDLEPPPTTRQALYDQVQGCRRCPLWRDATHGVCGEGPEQARIMIVGEQPGDQEDLADRPFVGPAGQILNSALIQAGIDRSEIFVTNAVRHFKHQVRGKRRIHETPEAAEVQACRWWLDAERTRVRPKVIVALGATAALSLLARKVNIGQERGRAVDLSDGSKLLLTIHPAYILHLKDAEARNRETAALVADLGAAKTLAETSD